MKECGVWADQLRALAHSEAPGRKAVDQDPHLLPSGSVAGLSVIAPQLTWKGTALSRNWATWLTNKGAYWNRAPWPESG